MEIMKKIFISDGDPDEGIQISQWEGEEDTYHMRFPEKSKWIQNAQGQLFYILLPNGSKVYLHADELEKVPYDKVDC